MTWTFIERLALLQKKQPPPRPSWSSKTTSVAGNQRKLMNRKKAWRRLYVCKASTTVDHYRLLCRQTKLFFGSVCVKTLCIRCRTILYICIHIQHICEMYTIVYNRTFVQIVGQSNNILQGSLRSAPTTISYGGCGLTVYVFMGF